MWTFSRFVVAWVFTLCVGAGVCLGSVVVGRHRMWVFSARRWARTTLWLVGVKLRIEGAENLKGPAVFISNHQSLIDVVFMPAILPPEVKFVAKRELLLIPLWGWGFAAGGAILIDRSKPRRAMADMAAGVQKMPKGWSVTIFPEGTRPKDGQLKPFKRGAFYIAAKTGLPVVPVGLDGARDIVPPDGWLVRPGEVRVVVGAPIPSAGWDTQDLGGPTELCRDAVKVCAEQAAQARQQDGWRRWRAISAACRTWMRPARRSCWKRSTTPLRASCDGIVDATDATRREALAALTGMRCDLFPGAAPYQPAPMATS